jgi:hypothetical protein
MSKFVFVAFFAENMMGTLFHDDHNTQKDPCGNLPLHTVTNSHASEKDRMMCFRSIFAASTPEMIEMMMNAPDELVSAHVVPFSFNLTSF